MSARVYGAQLSLEGQQIDTLRVLRVVSITPLCYEARCNVCSTSTVYTHGELRTLGRCKNVACGPMRERKEAEAKRRVQSARQTVPYTFDPMDLKVAPGKVW